MSIPKDQTVPDYPKNLSLYASFETVMFVFDANEEIDISQYEYELYNSGTVSGTYPNNTFSEQPVSTGFSASNVFTVSVTNSTKNDAGVVTSRSYIGRVRAKDTSGNPSVWSPVVQTDNSTPLISSQVVDTLTASKITAGTIGAHTITMAGANSIIKSSTFDGTAVGDGSYSGGTQGWLINGSGKAYFYDATIVGSLDIGGFDSGSFHVDTSGNMWLGSGSFSTAPFKVSSSGSVTSINGTIGGFTISSDKLLAGSGSNQITLSTGIYNATTNPDELVIAVGGNLSAGFGAPFAVNSSGVMNASAATVGPLQLDSSGLTSQFFNSDNYIILNTSGDFYKFAKRNTYYYLTYMLGEFLQIKRTNSSGTPTGSGAFFGYYSTPDDIKIILNAVSSPSYTSGAYVELNSSGQILASSSITGGSFSTSGNVIATGIVQASGNFQKSDGTRVRAAISNTELFFYDANSVQRSKYAFDGFYVDAGIITGNLSVSGTKNFVIKHPLYENKYLYHSAAESNRPDIYYRGMSQLQDGEVEINLPEYFEYISELENRTVTVTPYGEDKDDDISELFVSTVVDGKFKVWKKVGSSNNNQKFYWRVDAVRSNVDFQEITDMAPSI